MTTALRSLFNIRSGESRSIFLFALLGFLWALGAALAQRMSDALFYLHLGAEFLPNAFALRAIISLCIISFSLYSFASFPVKNIFITILSIGLFIFSLFNLGFFLGVTPEQRWFWYALKAFSNIFLLTLITNFWSFVDLYFDLEEAKRLYSLFNASVFLGFTAAGIILSYSLLTSAQLFIFVATSILLTLSLITYISRRYKIIHLEYSEEEVKPPFSFLGLARTIATNPFILAFLFCNVCVRIVAVFLEYHYMTSLGQLFPPNLCAENPDAASEQLTIFLGQCTTWTSLANIAFGTMIYSRLVQRFGVRNIFFITPLSFFLYFSEAPFAGASLLIPVFGFVINEGILYVLDDNNFNLLINTVPRQYKCQLRVTSESFFEPLGFLIGSLILFIPEVNYLYLGLGTSVVFILARFILRYYYSEEGVRQERFAFRKEKIADNALDPL